MFLSLDELHINMYMDRYNVIVKVILFITHFGRLPCLKISKCIVDLRQLFEDGLLTLLQITTVFISVFLTCQILLKYTGI